MLSPEDSAPEVPQSLFGPARRDRQCSASCSAVTCADSAKKQG
jgi:hypothetical protein